MSGHLIRIRIHFSPGSESPVSPLVWMIDCHYALNIQESWAWLHSPVVHEVSAFPFISIHSSKDKFMHDFEEY